MYARKCETPNMKNHDLVTKEQPAKKKQSRFQQLWSEATTLASDNDKLQADLDALVKRIDSEVFKAERQLGHTIVQVVHRQLDFTERKSLLKWQRATLDEWIDDHLNELQTMGLLDEAMQNRLATIRAAQMGIEIDPDSELSAVEQLHKLLEDDAAAFGLNFEDDDDYDDEDDFYNSMYDDDDDDDEHESEAAREFADILRRMFDDVENSSGRAPKSPDPAPDKTLNDEVFKRLFRQTAAALHPDKEPDEHRRNTKHELMAQLLKARKQNDLVTVLKLHEQYAQASSELTDTDQVALESVLANYLSQQQTRLKEIVMQSPMHQMAYHEFYHRKPATVTRRIKKHLKKIQKRHESLTDFMAHVKTLKSLKPVLEQRYDEQQERYRWF